MGMEWERERVGCCSWGDACTRACAYTHPPNSGSLAALRRGGREASGDGAGGERLGAFTVLLFQLAVSKRGLGQAGAVRGVSGGVCRAGAVRIELRPVLAVQVAADVEALLAVLAKEACEQHTLLSPSLGLDDEF